MAAWARGEAYEPYMGRWSRPVADELLAWLDVPAGARWLDVGCGTGALTRAILGRAAPADVLAVDASPGFVEFARRRVADPRVRFAVADATALPCGDATRDAAASGLVLNFVGRPERMAREMARAVRPGGTVAVYVWDYAGDMALLRRFWDAAIALDPAALGLDEGPRFPICRPEPLAATWRDAGLADVEVRAIDVPTRFRDFDDYWAPFLGGQGPAPAYVASLDDDRRLALAERLRATLATGPDGRIDLVARAWAVRGNRRNASARTADDTPPPRGRLRARR
jgi:SAM-dependent methyltransferase